MLQMVLNFGRTMLNFCYVIGDRNTKEALIIDPAWDPMGIVAHCRKKLKYKVVGVILTHGHVDHAGGIPPPPFDTFNVVVPGAKELIDQLKLPVYCSSDEANMISKACNIQ